jgi:5-methylcytosine-specific restriction endonuclease McrA
MTKHQHALQPDLFQVPADHRRCSTCRIVKPTSEFHKAASEPSGFKRQCKNCVKATFKAYYDKNQPAMVDRATLYQKTNPEKTRAYAKKAQAKGRVKFNAQKLAKYHEDKETISADRRERYATDADYRAAMRINAESGRAKRPDYYAEHDRRYRCENKGAYRTHSANYRAKKANADGSHTKEEWRERLEYFGYHCAYCLKHTSLVGTLAREHMVPLVRGGTNDIENIVPSCKFCNSAKRNRTPLEYLARLSGFAAVGPVPIAA